MYTNARAHPHNLDYFKICGEGVDTSGGELQYVAARGSAWQCDAVRDSALQCIAACFSALQYTGAGEYIYVQYMHIYIYIYIYIL